VSAEWQFRIRLNGSFTEDADALANSVHRTQKRASLSVARAVSATHLERAIDLYRSATVGLIVQPKLDI
jgi:hypothetical protein